MPLIIPANSLTGGYEVDNSLRFNSGSSDRLTRVQLSGSHRIGTISCWVKRSTLSTEQHTVSFESGDNYQMQIKFM